VLDGSVVAVPIPMVVLLLAAALLSAGFWSTTIRPTRSRTGLLIAAVPTSDVEIRWGIAG
jgi:hypothetical protein